MSENWVLPFLACIWVSKLLTCSTFTFRPFHEALFLAPPTLPPPLNQHIITGMKSHYFFPVGVEIDYIPSAALLETQVQVILDVAASNQHQ